MFLEGRLEKMAAGLRARHNIPLTLELWNGHEYRLGDAPRVKIRVPKASALS